ncbi:MAG: pantetheine-phosphate adenylyltransferase [Clostridia bacterium]|nr:pantetheine-phosphate adenylyltransferase [Clostridia bacterium]
MNIGFYAGSFDVFTYGHLLVVKKASILFDKLIIGMGVNENKRRRYDINLMKKAIEKTLEQEKLFNVEVIIYNGFTVTEAEKHHANNLVRGIRTLTDYQFEEDLATKNEVLSGIDTIYIRSGKFGCISSSFVKALIDEGGWDISKYVPTPVLELINNLEGIV